MQTPDKKQRRGLSPTQTIAVAFAAIILVGTFLLALPAASRSGVSCGFLPALFTATSSTCVTGLALFDTWSQWSIFGQIVILCMIEIPVWEKSNLTLEEAAAYSGIGINKLRKMSDSESCPFVLWIGSKRLIKRRKLDEYIDRMYSI